VFSAADFEDFRVERPDMPHEMQSELEGVVRILAQNRWPWRLHATYDETITRALDAFEAVNREIPLAGLHWFFDHAETISDRSIDRIAELGGGIAVQHRLADQGEYFVERYGAGAAAATPPVARMLEKGVHVSAGTDATRVASYNPWVSLAWLVTGRTVGGLRIYPQYNCLDRETALRMWTENVTWFSNEEGKKGRIEIGQLADLIVPDRDFFACAEDAIADTVSELTMVGGRVVYGAGDFARLDDAVPPPAMPDWSPVRSFGGYAAWGDPKGAGHAVVQRAAASSCGCARHCTIHGHDHATAWSSKLPIRDLKSFWGALGCACWAV
jgi:predicted amidohydrolase YtcJ